MTSEYSYRPGGYEYTAALSVLGPRLEQFTTHLSRPRASSTTLACTAKVCRAPDLRAPPVP
jgi:hypothetical protein